MWFNFVLWLCKTKVELWNGQEDTLSWFKYGKNIKVMTIDINLLHELPVPFIRLSSLRFKVGMFHIQNLLLGFVPFLCFLFILFCSWNVSKQTFPNILASKNIIKTNWKHKGWVNAIAFYLWRLGLNPDKPVHKLHNFESLVWTNLAVNGRSKGYNISCFSGSELGCNEQGL